MTIYQAIKHFTEATEKQELDQDQASLFDNAIWTKVHLIHYRIISPNNSVQTHETNDSKRVTRASQQFVASQAVTKQATSSQQKSIDILENMNNMSKSISETLFFHNMTAEWLSEFEMSINDQSINSISLLRLLNNLNRNWYLLYSDFYNLKQLANKFTQIDMNTNNLVSSEQFVNAKLTAKANRQLQDPLIIMTGHLPKWLPQLMSSCHFLFSFKTRLIYFYVSSMDRDRAMQKLSDLNSDLLSGASTDHASSASTSHSDRHGSDRFLPKLEKKKRTISRTNDLIKQTDAILNEFALLKPQKG